MTDESWVLYAPKALQDLHTVTSVINKEFADAIKAGWYNASKPYVDYYASEETRYGVNLYYEIGKRARELN